ncbi:hypothetical protein Hanom_Chr04g00304061 [Helianthus anomalus]
MQHYVCDSRILQLSTSLSYVKKKSFHHDICLKKFIDKLNILMSLINRYKESDCHSKLDIEFGTNGWWSIGKVKTFKHFGKRRFWVQISQTTDIRVYRVVKHFQ